MAGDLTSGVTTIPSGKGGVPQLLGPISTGIGGTIWVKPKHGNGNPMYIGPAAPGGQTLSAANGFELSPADPSTGPIDSVQGQDIYVVGSAGDSVCWMQVSP